MPITAFPKDIEVRKLTAAQAKAIEKYVKESNGESILKTALVVGIPTLAILGIAGGTAFLAWHWLKDKELPSWKDVQVAAGGVVSDVIIDVGGAAARAAGFSDDPTTPPDAYGQTNMTRCQRWELDALDIYTKVQEGLGPTETVQAALATKRVASNMKKEGCSRPSGISQKQWDES
tara:strand:- start:651 stop:1178 length:528 start_codon:yes stop_codon:yes gene_type:complete